MAATYQSIATASATNTNAVTVTKPTGLAVFELMVAIVSNGGRNDPATVATASGWTQLSNTNNSASGFALDTTVLAKFATSADVAASNFTFSVTNNTDVVLGTILRIGTYFSTVTGAYVIDFDTGATGGGTTFSGGLTPNESGSLLILAGTTGGGAANTHSGYAVTNNNPTWTERADFGTNFIDGSTIDFLNLGVATATYSVGTATGNYTVTNSNISFLNGHGVLISINETPADVTVVPTHLAVSPTINAPGMSAGVSFTPTHLAVSPTLNNPAAAGKASPNWSNVNKNSSTWSNPQKP